MCYVEIQRQKLDFNFYSINMQKSGGSYAFIVTKTAVFELNEFALTHSPELGFHCTDKQVWKLYVVTNQHMCRIGMHTWNKMQEKIYGQ